MPKARGARRMPRRSAWEHSSPVHRRLAAGVPLPGLYGAGIAFAEDEASSGAPYPEASLKAFTARARAIAADVGRRGSS